MRICAATGGGVDADRLVDEAVASKVQAIANKKRVIERAVEYLVSFRPGPEAETEPDSGEVDPDWLNHFGGYAEKATSEHVRDLWARVLGGEIRRPGSFRWPPCGFWRNWTGRWPPDSSTKPRFGSAESTSSNRTR